MEYDKEAVLFKNTAMKYLSEKIDRKVEKMTSEKGEKIITKHEVAQAFLSVILEIGMDVIYKYMDKEL